MQRRDFCKSSTLAVAFASSTVIAAPARADDIPAISGSGRAVTLSRSQVEGLRRSLKGVLLLRGDAGYDETRRVWNAGVDRKPALIVRCKDAGDVVQAVKFARTHDLLLAVRCGGHSSAGRGVCDDGLMVDLSPMRGVSVDREKLTARVEGGALLGDLDSASQAFGLATTTGTVSHTGVGGLTLGGGMGHLGRKYGLTIDNLLGADVVTATGKLVHSSPQENPDLFWAIRGGGGNFGIVTAFEFRLHEFGTRLAAGNLVYPWPLARKMLEFMREYGPTLRDEASITAALLATPDGQRVLTLAMHHTGSLSEAERVLEPLKKVAAPVNDARVADVPYLDFQRKWDDDARVRLHGYLKSGFVRELTPGLVEAAITAVEDPAMPVLQPLVFVHTGGAIARVDARATAFAHRDAAYAALIDLRWSDAAQSESHVGWARRAWQLLEPHTRGVYSNFTSNEDAQERLREAYGANLPRLVELKRKYDPTNLFRLNVNIEPA